MLTDFGVIEKKLHEVGIDNIEDLFILVANGYLPNMIYIQTQNEEYVMPIVGSSGLSNYKTGHLYKLVDLINSSIKLTEQAGQGDPSIPSQAGGSINLPEIKPITHVDEPKGNIHFIYISSFILLTLLTGIVVSYRLRLFSRKNNC